MTLLGLVRARTTSAVCSRCGHASASAEGPVSHLVRRARHVTTCRHYFFYDVYGDVDQGVCGCDDLSHRHGALI